MSLILCLSFYATILTPKHVGGSDFFEVDVLDVEYGALKQHRKLLSF